MISAVDYNTSKWSNEMREFSRETREYDMEGRREMRTKMSGNENGIGMEIHRRE